MAATKTQKATPKQVKYLHGLYRAVGWDEDMYKFVLYNDYGVESTKDLSISDANTLIRVLKAVVTGESNALASYRQCALIRHLWLEIDYSNGENGDEHLNAFLLKRFKKSKVEDLTKTEAIKLIKMINAMAKQAKERFGKTTVLKRTTICQYCAQEIMWVQLKSGQREPFDFETKDGELIATDFHNCKKEEI